MSTAKSSKDSKDVIAIYATHDRAERAIHELDKAGFDMKSMSLIGRDYHTEGRVVGYYHAGDRMKYWGKRSAFWGGIWGLLPDSAYIFIPGVGPFIVAGPLVAWIVDGPEDATGMGGLTVIGAGLVSLGIPGDAVAEYESALKAGKFVVINHGTAAESTRARDIFQNEGAESCYKHDVLSATEDHISSVAV